AIAASAGWLYAIANTFVFQDLLGLTDSVNFVLYSLVGGVDTVLGPLLGTAALRFLGEYLGQETAQSQVYVGVALLVVVYLLPAGACGGGNTGGGTSGQATGSLIKIGVLDDTGTGAPVEGPEMRVNTDLAIAQANASGGIHGHRLEAVYVNPNTTVDEAVTLAQQLVQQQGVDVLVGGVLSSECLAVEPLAARLQITYLS